MISCFFRRIVFFGRKKVVVGQIVKRAEKEELMIFCFWGVGVKLSLKRKGDLSDYNTRLLLFEHSVKVDMILKQVNRELGEYIFCFFLFGWWW